MSITINTNITSLRNQRELSKKTSELDDTFERLASGKRINKASDGAAELAIAMGLTESARTGTVAAQNISYGVSAADIAEGGLQAASDITSRLSELATQAANGTLSAEQRTALNNEYQALTAELDRISESTEFNGQQLLSGNSIAIQAGTTGQSSSAITLTTPEVSAAGLGLTANLLTQEGAKQALQQTKTATQTIADASGSIGATVSRLETAYEGIKTSVLNAVEASSRIQDADIAKEAADLTANRIGQNISSALGAQANLQPSLALRLLS